MDEKSSEALKCKRDKFQVDIRRKANEFIFANKRLREFSNIGMDMASSIERSAFCESRNISEECKYPQDMNLSISNSDSSTIEDAIEQHCIKLNASSMSKDIDDFIECMKQLRLFTHSHSKSYPFDIIVKHDVIKTIILFTSEFYLVREDLAFDSLWLCCNLLCIANCSERLIDAGFFKLIHDIVFRHEFSRRIICQATWCLANLSGESPEHRNTAINYGLIDITDSLLETNYIDSTEFDETLTWLTANVVRGKPYPEYELVKHYYKIMDKYLHKKSANCISETLWVYVSLSDNCIFNKRLDRLRDFFECELAVKKIIQLGIYTNEFNIKYPAYRAAINLSYTEEPDLLRTLIRNLIYNLVMAGFEHRDPKIRKASCIILVNMNSGGVDMIDHFYKSKILSHVKSLIYNDEFEIVKECLIALCNLTHKANREQIIRFKDIVLDIIIEKFPAFNDQTDFVIQFLDSLDALFHEGNLIVNSCQDFDQNPFVISFLQKGGAGILEFLQQSKDEKVYQKTIQIVDTNFKTEESLL